MFHSHVVVSTASFWVTCLSTRFIQGIRTWRWLKVGMQIWPLISCWRIIIAMTPIVYLIPMPSWMSRSHVPVAIARLRRITVCLLLIRFSQVTLSNRLHWLRILMQRCCRVITREWISAKEVVWCISLAKVPKNKFCYALTLWFFFFFFFFKISEYEFC